MSGEVISLVLGWAPLIWLDDISHLEGTPARCSLSFERIFMLIKMASDGGNTYMYFLVVIGN